MPTCNLCKYAGRPTYKSPCSECREFSEYEYENKKTNADRIRSMTDEELADFFRMWCRGIEDCADCHMHHEDCPGSCEFSAWIKWLQQPAEGE